MCLSALCGQALRPPPIHFIYLMGTKREGLGGLGGREGKGRAVDGEVGRGRGGGDGVEEFQGRE